MNWNSTKTSRLDFLLKKKICNKFIQAVCSFVFFTGKESTQGSVFGWSMTFGTQKHETISGFSPVEKTFLMISVSMLGSRPLKPYFILGHKADIFSYFLWRLHLVLCDVFRICVCALVTWTKRHRERVVCFSLCLSSQALYLSTHIIV